jgi:hypothetical protein
MDKLLGFLLIANAVTVTGWWVSRDYPHKSWVFAVCLVAVFAGVFLLVQERATEITIKGVGTIKAAAEQASVDAQVVAEVRKRIEAQSATVDLVAQQVANARRLGEELADKGRAAEKKLGELDQALAVAHSKVGELEAITEFTRTVLAAQNDDRRAFDRLEVWANDAAFRRRSEAAAAWATILDQHAKPFFLSGFTVPWKEGVDPATFGLAELRHEYTNVPVFLRPALIEYVWKREDIPKRDRMAWLADVVARDTSLNAVEYAGRLLSDALDAKLKPLAVKPLLQVWEQKKVTVK